MTRSWRKLPFEEALADQSAGNLKTPRSEFLNEGEFAVVDQGKELISGYINDRTRLCQSPLPVIVFGDHTRCLKFVDFPFCMGADGIKVLRPKGEAEVKYLYYFLRQVRLSDGGYDRHFKYLRRTQVLLPPLAEQRRIAEVLDRAEALRAKRRAALAHIDGLTQSIFFDLFGDPATNPKGWAMEQLGRFAEFRYGTSNKSGVTGKPAFRIPNVVHGTIDLSEIKLVSVSAAEFERLRLRDGDILFVRTNGNPEFVGRCAIFDRRMIAPTCFDCNEFIYASYLIRARLVAVSISPLFLREYLLSAEGRRQLRSRSKTSAGQFNINIESLGAIPVPLPPVSLQQEFARRVKSVAEMRTRQRASLIELDNLFASLQYRAFRGEL